MSPTAAELLEGNARVLAEQPSADAGAAFSASKIGIVNMINALVAQEQARAVEVRVAENDAIRALLSRAAGRDWAPALSLKLTALADGADEDLDIAALDRRNAALRRGLIELHAAIEGKVARERRVIALLRVMAEGRALKLPGAR
jgi:hypothetical protein